MVGRDEVERFGWVELEWLRSGSDKVDQCGLGWSKWCQGGFVRFYILCIILPLVYVPPNLCFPGLYSTILGSMLPHIWEINDNHGIAISDIDQQTVIAKGAGPERQIQRLDRQTRSTCQSKCPAKKCFTQAIS